MTVKIYLNKSKIQIKKNVEKVYASFFKNISEGFILQALHTYRQV